MSWHSQPITWRRDMEMKFSGLSEAQVQEGFTRTVETSKGSLSFVFGRELATSPLGGVSATLDDQECGFVWLTSDSGYIYFI